MLKVGVAGRGAGLAGMRYPPLSIRAPLFLHHPRPQARSRAKGVRNVTADGESAPREVKRSSKVQCMF